MYECLSKLLVKHDHPTTLDLATVTDFKGCLTSLSPCCFQVNLHVCTHNWARNCNEKNSLNLYYFPKSTVAYLIGQSRGLYTVGDIILLYLHTLSSGMARLLFSSISIALGLDSLYSVQLGLFK